MMLRFYVPKPLCMDHVFSNYHQFKFKRGYVCSSESVGRNKITSLPWRRLELWVVLLFKPFVPRHWMLLHQKTRYIYCRSMEIAWNLGIFIILLLKNCRAHTETRTKRFLKRNETKAVVLVPAEGQFILSRVAIITGQTRSGDETRVTMIVCTACSDKLEINNNNNVIINQTRGNHVSRGTV